MKRLSDVRSSSNSNNSNSHHQYAPVHAMRHAAAHDTACADSRHLSALVCPLCSVQSSMTAIRPSADARLEGAQIDTPSMLTACSATCLAVSMLASVTVLCRITMLSG